MEALRLGKAQGQSHLFLEFALYLVFYLKKVQVLVHTDS